MEQAAVTSSRRSIIVQKYGGSSVADVEKLGRVADKIVAARRAGHDVVVVVSAMGKTTDGLLALARQVAVLGEHQGEPPRRELDMLLSTGERVSMALLSIAIQSRGFDAISFTGSQSGILTNDRHFDARIIEVRPHRIEDELARGRIVIIAGYQGMSYRREITTLGRGGSDTTAVALAAALQAERCEIYSDVDGVYSADPRVVPEARHIPALDHAMLQEMAECGAKVLCAQAVEWARRAGIAIYARSTFDAGAAPQRETIVRRFGPSEEHRARAVVAEANVVLGELDDAAQLETLVQVSADARVPIHDLTVAARGGTFLISLLNVPDWGAQRERLTSAVPSLRLTEGLSLVSVVGDGFTATTEPLSRFLRTLAGLGTPPVLTLATPLRLGALVPAARAGEAQRALHAAFVTGDEGAS
jgi:aspartate kinase